MNSTAIQSYLHNMQNSTATVEAEKSKERMGNATLDKHSFLMLMMEQLKNQNPLDPMKNEEFLAQQAQMTQVEELQNLNANITRGNLLSQSSTLIGKVVAIENPDNPEAEYITGLVSSAAMNSEGAAIEVNGKYYPIDLVRQVTNVEYIQDPEQDITETETE